MRDFFGINFLFIFLCFIVISLFIYQQPTFAIDEKLPVITVINPIRGNELGHEKDDLLVGLKYQWELTKGAKVDAAWLWQYSALENEKMVNFAKKNMKNQEFGIFLEIDRNFAKKSGIQYRGQGPWYFSDGLLLMSYDKNERERLIEEVFSKFKKTFGYYPKTVGAWWIGADSLVYMQQKYGITAAMRASDQYDLDVYSIWGTPWSIPYVASKVNEGMPASSNSDSSRVVMLQWAPRDPTRGYNDFAYSVQDFTLRDDNFSYVNYLASVFLHKPLDNMVIGLENSGTSAPLEIYYAKIVKKARELADKRQVRIVLAKDYAAEFLAINKPFAASDTKFYLTKDYKSDDQSFWYNSPNFRAGIIKTGENVYLIDLRDYASRKDEDFSSLPNSQGYLRVMMPAIIDSIRFPDSKILLIKTSKPLKISQKVDDVTLFSDNKKLAFFTNSSLDLFLNGNIKSFSFEKKTNSINIFYGLLTLYLFYFGVVYLHKRNIVKSAISLSPLIITLFIAYPFLNANINTSQFIFDRKELLLLPIASYFSFLPTANFIIIFKLLPLVLLMVLHYIFTVILKARQWKIVYFIVLSCVVIYYSHSIYFPLDRSTYPFVFLVFFILFCALIAISVLVYKKTKSKKRLSAILLSVPLIFIILGGIIYFSRTKIILSSFEMDALTTIKERHKDVLLVSEYDYNIKPIYKAAKPVLYENYHLGERFTNTRWQIVVRPENNMLNITDYNDKVIVVPRYLGADLSNKEMQLLKLKKIFDNVQIAIFEKE